VVFTGCAHHEAIPRLFSSGNGQVKAAIEIGGVEAEEFSQEISWVIFKGFEDP
jgi:hypothetical protein